MIAIPWPSGWANGCPKCLVGVPGLLSDPAFNCDVCEGTGVPKRVRAIVKLLNDDPDFGVVELDGSEPLVEQLYKLVDDTAIQGLITATTECLTACACLFRVVAQIDAATAVGNKAFNREAAVLHEFKAEGIADGFGQRAREAIKRAEAQ